MASAAASALRDTAALMRMEPQHDRRAALAAIAGVGAALSLPKAVRAMPAVISPDAPLIAQAALVVRLAERASAAWLRASKADDRCMLASPERPMVTVSSPARGEYAELPAAELRQYIAEAAADMSPTDPWMIDRRGRLARMEAYESECAQLERRFRVKATGQLAHRAEARLQEAAVTLTAMRPATMAGLLAKARASAALPIDDEQSGCQWAEDLAGAVVRELVAIGGEA